MEFLRYNPNIKDVLFKNGILIEKERNELIKILEKRDAIANTDEALDLLIAPTLKCNLNCGYCFQKNLNKVCEIDISNDIFNFVSNKKSLKFFDVRWFGGAPTLKLNSIVLLSEKFLELTKKNNIYYQAETNYYYAIAPNGSLYKCDFDIGKQKYKMGNISDNMFFNIKKLREISHKCKECKMFPVCLGGCMKTKTCSTFTYK